MAATVEDSSETATHIVSIYLPAVRYMPKLTNATIYSLIVGVIRPIMRIKESSART